MGIMARIISIVVIIAIALIYVLAKEELYDDKYDYVDVRALLNNERMRLQYYHCFMDFGPCKTADAKFFKEIIFEAISTKCKKCTERQKDMLDVTLDWFSSNKPDQLKALIKKMLDDAKRKYGGQ